jgi:hypothetical protein
MTAVGFVGAGQLGVSKDVLLAAVGACSGASYAARTRVRLPDVDAFGAAAGPFLRKDVAACELELRAAQATADLLLAVVRNGRLALQPAAGDA